MKSIESALQFNTEVLTSELPVLVDFYADWCGPCKVVLPMLEAIEPEYTGRMTFVKVNSEQVGDIARQYHVRSLPTILILKGGVVEETKIGMPATGRELRAMLDRALA
ncbi:MAG TPA: thioredoxin [Luteimonas sp.]